MWDGAFTWKNALEPLDEMEKNSLKIVIVGGVAGGASAATRARRMNESAHIVLFEKDDHVSFANCGLPYYIGGEITERKKLLVASKELLERRFRLDVRIRSRVESINRDEKSITVQDLSSGDLYQETYDKLILSPGAIPIVPTGADNAPNVYSLRNLYDTDGIRRATDESKSKKAIVVGGGFIGLEMVEQLVERGFDVSLIERNSQVLVPLDAEMAEPLEEILLARGVKLYLNDGMKGLVLGEDGLARGIELETGREVEADLIILGLGVRPSVELAEAAGLRIGASGAIAVNRYLQTSDPDIYAVGDAVEYPYGPTGTPLKIALAGPANRAGRLAGEHAVTGKSAELADIYGTAIVRVFDLTAAITGLSRKFASKIKQEAKSVTIVSNQHAGYFPGATPITLKLVYDPNDGRILGAQAIGREGVDKRIDVIATAMSFGAKVSDLAGLDLAYAPPYGSAKDPIHMAAFVADNELSGVERLLDSDTELSKYQIVDVRTEAEVSSKPLVGAKNVINIPLDDLRDRLDELDRSVGTVVSCAVGVRGHVASRILLQNGFDEVFNLTGGATIRARHKEF